ncbi:LysM peptidoglycan-binding domain-containing protein [Prolixibacteraceae bacterium JC049]|nr:LysM peptidoglycan-binding domain-containing protein [Prolixibacteraceae bacterium JC049]
MPLKHLFLIAALAVTCNVKAQQQDTITGNKSIAKTDSTLSQPTQVKDTIATPAAGYLSSFLIPGNKGRIISHFGPRSGRMHYGTDLKMNNGDTVVASNNGVIFRANWGTGFGRLVVVQHDKNIQTYYAHLSKFLVKKGDTIRKGEPIGLAGRSGRARGYHLHFEIHEKKRAFDSEMVFNYKKQQIRSEAQTEETLVALHRKLKPKGYAHNAAVPEYYKVRSGDSLWKISRKFKTSIKEICRLNRIKKTAILKIGQPLKMY